MQSILPDLKICQETKDEGIKIESDKCKRCGYPLRKWFNQQVLEGLHCGNCGLFEQIKN